MNLYNRLSPRREKVIKEPLFPLNVECRVHGFDDDPETVYTGYFRKIENHKTVLFQYENNTKYRLANLDYLGNVVVIPVESNERWEYYTYGDKKWPSLLTL